MTPAWILDIFAALMLIVAGISAGRLLVSRSWSGQAPDADIDAAHILMGVAMAGMLASGLRTFPNGAWVAVFAVVTAWFAWRAVAEARSASTAIAMGTGHHVPHLIHGAAMIYMFVAVTGATSSGGGGMSGMGGMSGTMGTLRLPTIGFVFVLLMIGWAVVDLDQLTGARWRGHGSPRAGAGTVPPALRQRIALAAAGGPALETAGSGPALAVAQASVSAGGTDSAALAATADGPASGTVTASPVAGVLLDPRVTIGSRIAMSVTMALMLVLMI
jgi:Domain of unknown function (DUF5134)